MGRPMRRWVGLASAAAVAAGVMSLGLLQPAGQTPATPGGIRRTADGSGKPDFNGVWQALTTASWDLEDHNAQKGVPAGQSRGPGGAIPYLPAAAARKKEQAAKRTELDPLHKCYLPGIRASCTCRFPFASTRRPSS